MNIGTLELLPYSAKLLTRLTLFDRHPVILREARRIS